MFYRFGRGKGKVWMSDVGCTGTEARLQDCGFTRYNIYSCLHSHDAGVRCTGESACAAESTLSFESGRPPVRFPLSPRRFSRSSHTRDLKTGTPVAALSAACRCRVNAGTGWPSVSIHGCDVCNAIVSRLFACPHVRLFLWGTGRDQRNNISCSRVIHHLD